MTPCGRAGRTDVVPSATSVPTSWTPSSSARSEPPSCVPRCSGTERSNASPGRTAHGIGKGQPTSPTDRRLRSTGRRRPRRSRLRASPETAPPRVIDEVRATGWRVEIAFASPSMINPIGPSPQQLRRLPVGLAEAHHEVASTPRSQCQGMTSCVSLVVTTGDGVRLRQATTGKGLCPSDDTRRSGGRHRALLTASSARFSCPTPREYSWPLQSCAMTGSPGCPMTGGCGRYRAGAGVTGAR